MPPRDQRLSPEAAAAREAKREAARERRRKAREEELRPPSPEEIREQGRRMALDALGCLLPMPAVAAVAGVAVVVAGGEAIPVALVATVAGTITGWLMIFVLVFVSENYAFRGVAGAVTDWADPYLPLAAAVGVTLLVSRIL